MKAMLKKILVDVANRAGYKITANWRTDGFEFANHLMFIFQKLNVDFVIDVGANRGQYYDFLRNQVGYKGKIMSFEPIPELFEVLRERAKNDEKWEVRNCALGSSQGSLIFNIMRTTEFSSFLNRNRSHPPFACI